MSSSDTLIRSGGPSAAGFAAHLRWKRKATNSGDGRHALLFLLPFCAFLLVFQYYSIGLMVRNSLFSYSLLNTSHETFVGLSNYGQIVHDPIAIQSREVTLLFAVGIAITQVPLGLGLAILLNRRRRGVALIRAVAFSPVVTSVVVVATMWTFIFAPSDGLANSVLHVLGLGPFRFVTSSSEALASIILMTLWEEVGFSMVIYLAGLQSIPSIYEEAAAVDGAGPIGRFWYGVLPLLRRTTVLVVVVSTVFALQAFAQAYIMTNGGPDGSTNFMVFNIYSEAFSLGNPGYASALAVVLLLIVVVITTVQLRVLRSRVD
jgi:multiple sugar transport system permease protein